MALFGLDESTRLNWMFLLTFLMSIVLTVLIAIMFARQQSMEDDLTAVKDVVTAAP